MIAIFTPLNVAGFELCHPIPPTTFEMINGLINGEPRASTWEPFSVKLIQEDRGQQLRPSDSPWLGEHAMIFKQSAVNALGSILREHGELLPVLCEGQDLVIFNPTRIVDVLDEEASDVIRFSTGRLMDVKRFVFKAAAILDVDIFKIPNFRVSPTFVSARVVALWHEAHLEGLQFQEVWRGQPPLAN